MSDSSPPAEPGSEYRTGRFALFVAAGILLSRLVGLVRLRAFAYYFGVQSDAADAFNAGFRIPNLLQNLFGEGVLSASFIPVYASVLARGDEKEAGRLAGAIAAILSLITSAVVLAGILAAPVLVDLIAPGFEGAKRELTVRVVQILFPGAGLLVLSAWCLGILNSHGRFFLSYAAPVIWNAAMIAALVGFGGRVDQPRLAIALAWGSVAGSLLQFAVQLPVVARLARRLHLSLGRGMASVRTVLRNFVPVFFSRGVVQISAYVDAMIASLLPTGAMTGLANAQLLYTLPVSLFGMSVSAAELPAMSSALGTEEEIAGALRQRLNSGLRRIAFFVVPSAVAFAALGDVISAALLQTGRFTYQDAVYVWGILAGYSVGLLASTLGRLYSSTYYALRDTRTPLQFAIVRVSMAGALGIAFATQLPGMMGVEERWGVVGLTLASAIAGWVEFALLRHRLNRRIGETGLPLAFSIRVWSAGLLAAAAGWGVKLAVGAAGPLVAAALILPAFGIVYFGMTFASGIPEARALFRRVRRSGS